MGFAFRKKTKNNYIQYTFRIREHILEGLREIAKKEDLSLNEVVNQSLERAIEEYKK